MSQPEDIRSKIPVTDLDTQNKEKKGIPQPSKVQPPQTEQIPRDAGSAFLRSVANPKTPAQQTVPLPQQKLIPARPSTKLPVVYEVSNVAPVCDTEEFNITDLFMKSTQGQVLWTTVYVQLKPFKQSLWFKNLDADLKYTIVSGECWFLINQSGAVVTAGMMICVPRGNFHMLLNNSGNDCRYTFEAPGKLDLREYLRGA